MKPIITFALSAVLAFTFASCNKQSSQSPLEQQYVVWSDIDTDIQQIVMEEVNARQDINQAYWACALVLNERGEGIAGYERYDSTTTCYHLTDKQAIGTLFTPFSVLMDSCQEIDCALPVTITDTDVITTPEYVAWLYHCLTHGLFPEEWHVESSGVLESLHDCVWNNERGTASVTRISDIIIYDRAQSDKVAIMGRTGSRMIDNDPHKHVISFVGIFPEDNPQYTCLVMFGNPKGIYCAGVDCGGTVRRIAERIMTK